MESQSVKSSLGLRNGPAVYAVSMMQLILGGLIFLLEVIGLSLLMVRMDLVTGIAAGIWAGLIFMTTGVTGITVTQPSMFQDGDRRKRMFTVYSVLSLVSCLLALGLTLYSIYAVFNGPHLCVGFDNHTPDGCMTYSDAFMPLRFFSAVTYAVLSVLFAVTTGLGCCNVRQVKTPEQRLVFNQQ